MADLGTSAIIGLVSGGISTALSAASTIAGGAAANKQAKAQARLLQQQADQERAAANREAQKKRAQTDLVLSRQQALAASGGGGPSDPTILDLMGATAAEGEVQAEEAQYGGELRANDLLNQAAYVRQQGKAAKQSSLFKAGTTLVGGGVSLAGKYGLFDDSRSYSSTSRHEAFHGGLYR